jgi:UDP:flavonoid glycosyltransferase YjiC (YdhE family)
MTKIAVVTLGTRGLTSQKSAKAINFISDPKIIANAAKLGEKLRTENGVANAVKVIELFLKK